MREHRMVNKRCFQKRQRSRTKLIARADEQKGLGRLLYNCVPQSRVPEIRKQGPASFARMEFAAAHKNVLPRFAFHVG